MQTVLRLSRADEGRRLSLQDFESGRYQAGRHYELVSGRFRSRPWKSPLHDWFRAWLYNSTQHFEKRRPGDFGLQTTFGGLILPREVCRASYLCPDVTMYLKFPFHLPIAEVTWAQLQPSIIAEILCPEFSAKLVYRKARIYRSLPSLKELWILDARKDPMKPTLVVRHRRGSRWLKRDYQFGETYTSKLIPGYSLPIDPRREP